MMKRICAMIFCLAIFANICEAAENNKPRVAVMDLGVYGSQPSNAGLIASEFLMKALFDTGRFDLIDWENANEISEEKLLTTGLIPLSVARRIAEIIKVDYLIYGNMSGVNSQDLTFEIAGNGGHIRSVKCSMIVRVMDVKAGEDIIYAQGEGVSKTSELKANTKGLKMSIGGKEVPTICVRNSVSKASRDAVDKIVADFFNEPPTKK